VSLGIVSALDRSIYIPERNVTLHGLIQTDAAINPGNSGGPLINLKGEVIGINTAIIRGAQNIGFAIASAMAIPIRDELLRYGKVRWPWLGVSITTLTSTLASKVGTTATRGVLILEVFRGNPAERAGLRAGDVIIKLDETGTPDLATFQKALRNYRAGDRVEVTFIRKNQTLKTTVILGEMPLS
jgi:serine protease Do